MKKQRTLEDVRAVLRAELSGELRGQSLITRCTRLSLVLTRTEGFRSFPESVWHYLTDADIRVRDVAFASEQLEYMAAVLGAR